MRLAVTPAASSGKLFQCLTQLCQHALRVVGPIVKLHQVFHIAPDNLVNGFFLAFGQAQTDKGAGKLLLHTEDNAGAL